MGKYNKYFSQFQKLIPPNASICRYLTTLGPKLGLKTREEMMDFMCKKTGQKRVLEPYEIGKVATFLCKSGKCITGMSINADGGIHLG